MALQVFGFNYKERDFYYQGGKKYIKGFFIRRGLFKHVVIKFMMHKVHGKT